MYRETNLQERLQYQVRNLESLGLSQRFVRVVHFFLLVVWNMNFIFSYIGNNKPNWRTHIFQRGGSTTNQWSFRCSLKPFDFLSPLAANFVQHHTFGNWSRARARQKEVSMFVEAFWSWKTPGILGTFYNALREERKCPLELEMSQSWGRRRRDTLRQPEISRSQCSFSYPIGSMVLLYIYILWCAMDPINIPHLC